MNKKNEQNNNEFNDDEQINLFESSKEDSQSYKFGKSNLLFEEFKFVSDN